MPVVRSWLASRERLILAVLGLGGAFAMWQVAANLHLINNTFFSSPAQIVSTGIAEVQLPRFWSSLQVSTIEFGVGFLGAAFIGVPLGLIIGMSKMLNDLLEPWLTFFYSLPRLALAPLILLWMGLGIWTTIMIVFLGAFFTIMVNTIRGSRVVDPRFLAVASSCDASRMKIFTTVVLPGSVPMILVGLRLGVSRALTGVVVGEIFAGGGGLGQTIMLASNSLQISRVLFLTCLLIAIGVLAVLLLARLERRFAAWRDDLSTAS